MKSQAFDELSKQVATATTRRQALRYFAVAAGATVLPWTAASPAQAARCRKNDQPCRASSECCSQFCDPTTGRCAGCDPGTVACGGTCVSACTAPLVLNPLTCACECPNGTAPCGTTCCSTFYVCCAQSNSCCPPLTTCCGAGNCCTSAQVCQSGACCTPEGAPCTSSQECCGGGRCAQVSKTGPAVCGPAKLP